jgi:hypothetical protein
MMPDSNKEQMAQLPGGRYRHFKGKEYEVLGVARHSETDEPFVVYRPLYGGFELTVRPASMFSEQVNRDGRTQPRFTYMGPPSVKKLSQEAQQAARTFLFSFGRPLEQARFRHSFENGSLDDVYAALAAFQNRDGGFGHGLEPDLQTPHSSVLATTVALQTLRAVNAPGDHPLVAGAMGFLSASFDDQQMCWPIIPDSADNAPHAPWWSVDAALPDRFGGFLVNPRAEALGYFYAYPDYAALIPLQEVTHTLLDHLTTLPDPLEIHDFLCCERLLATPGLPAPAFARLVSRLAQALAQTVAFFPEQWAGYGLPPLAAAPTPTSPLSGHLADALPANLDYLVASQGEDGAWSPTWTWSGLFPATWPAAERAWKSILTFSALHQLAAFGRLAL